MRKGQVCGERGCCAGLGSSYGSRAAPDLTQQGRGGLCYTWQGVLRPYRQLGDQQVLWRQQVDVSTTDSSQRLPGAVCKEPAAASQGTQEHCN